MLSHNHFLKLTSLGLISSSKQKTQWLNEAYKLTVYSDKLFYFDSFRRKKVKKKTKEETAT